MSLFNASAYHQKTALSLELPAENNCVPWCHGFIKKNLIDNEGAYSKIWIFGSGFFYMKAQTHCMKFQLHS